MPNMEDLKRRIIRIVANCNRPKVKTPREVLLELGLIGAVPRAVPGPSSERLAGQVATALSVGQLSHRLAAPWES